MISNMDNVGGNLLILQDLNVLNIFESRVVNVNRTILSSCHENTMPNSFLMSEILLDESHHCVTGKIG